jgi:hypothetical protein
VRKAFKIVLAAAVGTVVVPALGYSLMTPSDEDPMGQTLREIGFVRVPLPSNLMNVGSLYYVDAGLTDFKTACHAASIDLGDNVIVSRSGDIERILERKGGLKTDVAVDFGVLFGATFDDNYVHRVHLSLTDVVVEELPLDRGEDVAVKLMKEPRCDNIAMRFINDAPRGYVCQVQKTLKATAEIKLDRDVRDELETSAKVPDVNGKIKEAIETQTNLSVVERDGRFFTGAALTYGVSMSPTCLAPGTALFQRTLPRNRFDRLVNFVKFDMVEPLWPVHADETKTAEEKADVQAAHGLHEFWKDGRRRAAELAGAAAVNWGLSHKKPHGGAGL